MPLYPQRQGSPALLLVSWLGREAGRWQEGQPGEPPTASHWLSLQDEEGVGSLRYRVYGAERGIPQEL